MFGTDGISSCSGVDQLDNRKGSSLHICRLLCNRNEGKGFCHQQKQTDRKKVIGIQAALEGVAGDCVHCAVLQCN